MVQRLGLMTDAERAEFERGEIIRQKELREQIAIEFRPKFDVSADARHIVKHMWIIFVLLPFVLGLLIAFVRSL